MSTPAENPISRESSVFEPPEYEIFYGSDHTLQWEPPAGSMDLAVALSYHFPLPTDLESKMRTAMKKFLRNEAKITRRLRNSDSRPRSRLREGEGSRIGVSVQTNPEASEEPSVEAAKEAQSQSHKRQQEGAGSPMASEPTFAIIEWNHNTECSDKNRKKRRYERSEAAKVSANRGYACKEHRRRKIKCDPERCPMNGQSTKLIRPPLHEEKAMMGYQDEADLLKFIEEPPLKPRSSDLQMLAKGKTFNGDKREEPLHFVVKSTAALGSNNRKFDSTTEESPPVRQVLNNTLLNVFDPIPSFTTDNSWGNYSSWFDDTPLLQDSEWNLEGVYVNDSFSGGKAEGETIAEILARSKDLEARIARGLPLLPIHSYTMLHAISELDYLTTNEKTIDKHFHIGQAQSSILCNIERQGPSKLLNENTEPFARSVMSSFDPARDMDEKFVRRMIWNQNLRSINVGLEADVDDEHKATGQTDHYLTENLTSLIANTGLMYI